MDLRTPRRKTHRVGGSERLQQQLMERLLFALWLKLMATPLAGRAEFRAPSWIGLKPEEERPKSPRFSDWKQSWMVFA